MHLFCTPDPKSADKNTSLPTSIGVKLFGDARNGVPRLGALIASQINHWPYQPTQKAWDFLSIALAITAADLFISRSTAADGWTREFEIKVCIEEPKTWTPSTKLISTMLSFLSGDHWQVTFVSGGNKVPSITKEELALDDCICLFSGGLDSLVGAIDLIEKKRNPILVSHLTRGQGEAQNLATRLGNAKLRHFQVNADPHGLEALMVGRQFETSTRTRSLLYIALAVVIASGLKVKKNKAVEIYVPENGFISLNVPLSLDRIGSLSTRTTAIITLT